MPKVFLSHSSKDKPKVRKIADKLHDAGIEVWIDESEIKIGDSLIEKISKGIMETDCLVAFISSNSIHSQWVQKELRLAVTSEILEGKVQVLPVVLDKCDIPIFLLDKLYADFRAPDTEALEMEKLIRSIHSSSAKLDQTEQVYVDTSAANRERELVTNRRRRKQLFFGTLVVAFLIFLGVFSISKSREAQNAHRESIQQETQIAANATQAQSEMHRAEIAENLARAHLLVSQGETQFEDNPLLGFRLALEGLAVLQKISPDAHVSVMDTILEMARQGRLAKLGDDVENMYHNSSGSIIILDYDHTTGKIFRSIDGSLITTLSDEVIDVSFSPDQDHTYFVVNYTRAPSEVRRSTDGTLISKLTDLASHVYFSPNSNAISFVVDYINTPDEVRSITNGTLLSTLSGDVYAVEFSPDPYTRYFIVDYVDASDELRYTSTGTVVPVTSEIKKVYFSSSNNANIFVIRYSDSAIRSELRNIEDGLLLTELPQRVSSVFFSPNPDATSFMIGYNNKPAEIRSLLDGTLINSPLSDIVLSDIDFSPDIDATYFFVKYSYATDTPSEVRRTSDGELIFTSIQKYGWAYFSPDPEATYFLIKYSGASNQIRRTADGTLITSLPDRIDNVYHSPNLNSKSFVLSYDDTPGEIRSTKDGELITTLPDLVDGVYFSQDVNVNYIIVNYALLPDQLLRTSDGSVIATFTGNVDGAYFSPYPDSSVFVISYVDEPGEIRRTLDGSLITKLDRKITNVYFSPDPKTIFFVVGYGEGARLESILEEYYGGRMSQEEISYRFSPGEMRFTADGSQVPLLDDVYGVTFSLDTEASYFVVSYGNNRSELWRGQGNTRLLAELGMGRINQNLDLLNSRLAVHYSDGRVYLLDLDWLETTTNDEAIIDPTELIRQSCEGPFALGIFDEAMLDSYLNGVKSQICE